MIKDKLFKLLNESVGDLLTPMSKEEHNKINNKLLNNVNIYYNSALKEEEWLWNMAQKGFPESLEKQAEFITSGIYDREPELPKGEYIQKIYHKLYDMVMDGLK